MQHAERGRSGGRERSCRPRYSGGVMAMAHEGRASGRLWNSGGNPPSGVSRLVCCRRLSGYLSTGRKGPLYLGGSADIIT